MPTKNNEAKDLPSTDVLSGMMDQISELMSTISEMMNRFVEYISSLLTELSKEAEEDNSES